MDINLLKEVLSVPTVYEHEGKMVDFLISWGIRHSITVIVDAAGNVYLKKGSVAEGEYYPCVIGHMDTVHSDHKLVIGSNTKLDITQTESLGRTILTATNPITNMKTGIGGDDKAGIAICLDIISKTDKIIGAFFFSEEIGCLGARKADQEIFSKVGYAIEFDAPGSDWVSYVSCKTQLFNKEFFKLIDPILLTYGISNIHDNDPFTDIYIIKRIFDFNCINFFAGYYRMHSSDEYVIYEDSQKAANMGKEIIDLLGSKKYELKYVRKPEPMSNVIF